MDNKTRKIMMCSKTLADAMLATDEWLLLVMIKSPNEAAAKDRFLAAWERNDAALKAMVEKQIRTTD